MSAITNRQAADVLFNVATLLEAADDNPYRVRAYRRAARLLLQEGDHPPPLTTAGDLDIPGLGPALRRRLGEMIRTGRLRFAIEVMQPPREGRE